MISKQTPISSMGWRAAFWYFVDLSSSYPWTWEGGMLHLFSSWKSLYLKLRYIFFITWYRKVYIIMKSRFNNIIKLLQAATITSFLFPHRWRTATRTIMWCYGCGRWCAGKRNIAMRSCILAFRTIIILRNHCCASPLPRCDSHLKVNTDVILFTLQKKISTD